MKSQQSIDRDHHHFLKRFYDYYSEQTPANIVGQFMELFGKVSMRIVESVDAYVLMRSTCGIVLGALCMRGTPESPME